MSYSISQTSQIRRQHIKKFQSRVLNRSCADFLFYDKLADFLLQCCSAEAKPNTLSLFSLLPLIVCNMIIAPGEWWGYIIAIVAFLMHQVFDIANKKQAYRLSEFNLTTYYLDHLYDSISCVEIVDITGKLFQLSNQTRLTCIFFFAMLPFFTHHLAMYANGYLTFYNFSPAVQGLLFLEILFVFCAIFPQIPSLVIIHFKIYQIVIALCLLWLLIFLIDDLRTILRMKKDSQPGALNIDQSPIKNLFVISIIGYIIMQITMISQSLLNDKIYYLLCSWTLTLIYTYTVSQLILSYGFSEKHRQFTLNILISLFFVVLYYSICGLAQLEEEIELLIGRIMFGLLFGVQLIYFFYYHYSNVKYLNSTIRDE